MKAANPGEGQLVWGRGTACRAPTPFTALLKLIGTRRRTNGDRATIRLPPLVFRLSEQFLNLSLQPFLGRFYSAAGAVACSSTQLSVRLAGAVFSGADNHRHRQG